MLGFLVVLGCFIVTVTGKTCGRIPPGVSRLRKGVDVTALDLFPLQDAQVDGVKKNIIDFTCNGKKWTSNNIVYDLPDEVSSISLLPRTYSKVDVNIHKSSRDVRQTMSASVGGSLLGLFSASASYRKMQQTLSQGARYIADASHTKSTVQVNLEPYWMLSPRTSLKRFIDRILPAAYDDRVYKEFISHFGTHYFSEAKLGGRARLYMSTESSYYNNRNDRDVKAQASGTFFSKFNANAGGQTSKTTIDAQFTQKSKIIKRVYGGNITPDRLNNIQAWEATVASYPSILYVKLQAISNIIGDKKKAANMEKAVGYHLRLAELRDVKRTIPGLYKSYGRVIAQLQTLERTVDRYIASGKPTQGQVQSAKNTLDGYIVPTWFMNDVSLCYDWFPDDDGGQCGGGAKRRLCSKYGAMTAEYRDDTDGRGGGCQMRWGLQTTNPSSFVSLTGVKMCYIWRKDGDGQCSGVRGTECVDVNRYTSFYRDDTDRRHGGCRMQWLLLVPSTAPFWLRSMRFCFSWRADGDSGQCGDHSRGKTLCAVANSWTAAYRDDTDNRDGGCWMKWGLMHK